MTFSPVTLGSGLAGYNFLQKTRPTQQAVFEKSAPVKRAADAFKADIQKIQTSEDLLDNRRLLGVALGAFGLEEDINNRAFLSQILDSDLTDRTSLANRLADKRYLAFAKTFNFTDPANPGLTGISTENSIKAQLKDVTRADDLLNNSALLRATLDATGLSRDRNNTFFLKQVLESNVADPNSFANRLSDPKYAQLATAFDLAEKTQNTVNIYGFVATFKDSANGLETADDLLNDPELLNAALDMFGLEKDVNRTGFLRSVLESDLSDDASVANTQGDKRYAALSDAFGFGETTPLAEGEKTKLQSYVDIVSARSEKATTATEFLQDSQLLRVTMDLFGLSSTTKNASRLSRVLNSDRSDPVSDYNVLTDGRFIALADGLNFPPAQQGRVYPAEFVDNIVQNYIDRQFEISIGESDPTMRISLAMERELENVVANGASNDSRWFSIMASRPLRTVFETAFQLPSAFGTLDIDRQLETLKDRAERFFGTNDVGELLASDTLKDVRERYLTQSGLSGGQNPSQANTASIILASI